MCAIHPPPIYVTKRIAAPRGPVRPPFPPRLFADAAMSVRVFVSSTKNDLDPDCRPEVLRAIALAEAIAVAMETWPAEYLPALDLVKRKIDESTHYLGLFAYRRGWEPDGTTSITEAEFDHARGRLPRQALAVFIPKEKSPIAEVLLARAREAQDLASEEQQARFLDRVGGAGVVESFDSVPDLSIRATRCVIFWNKPLLERKLEPPDDDAPAAPSPDELALLGRRAQADCFEADVLARLARAGGTSAAGALVSGPVGHGHPQVLSRLQRAFEAVSRRTHPCTIGCGPFWRGNSLSTLLTVLAKETGSTTPFPTVAAAAAYLGTQLAQKDVLLRVTAVQNFENGVAGFVEQFWAPLLDALPAGTTFRLLCLASHEGRTPAAPAWDAVTQPCGADPFDPRRLVRLPALEPFTETELSLFVRGRVEPARADELVAALMAESNEGVPNLLYEKLADPTYWTL